MPNQSLRFSLNIPQNKILHFYRGHVKNLIVTLDSGKRVQLPLVNFQPYISEHGLYGDFEVIFSDKFKLITLKRLA